MEHPVNEPVDQPKGYSEPHYVFERIRQMRAAGMDFYAAKAAAFAECGKMPFEGDWIR